MLLVKVLDGELVRRSFLVATIGAYIITNTILGAPYYNNRIVGPQTLF